MCEIHFNAFHLVFMCAANILLSFTFWYMYNFIFIFMDLNLFVVTVVIIKYNVSYTHLITTINIIFCFFVTGAIEKILSWLRDNH